jgi:tetratricopeptide (TPR) repeat protein
MWGGLSLYTEGTERFEAAASLLPAAASLHEQARLWLWLGFLLEQSAPARAIAAFERSCELYGALVDDQRLAHAALWLARALTIVGRYEASASALAMALPALERSSLPKLRAFYLANAGFLKTQTSDLGDDCRLRRRRACSEGRQTPDQRSACAGTGEQAREPILRCRCARAASALGRQAEYSGGVSPCARRVSRVQVRARARSSSSASAGSAYRSAGRARRARSATRTSS